MFGPYSHPLLRELHERWHWSWALEAGISIVDEHKLVYVEASKCACTQVKTLLADILAAPHRFDRSLSPHKKENTGLKSIAALGEEKVAEALTAQDWYRFAVVRDPFDRIVSAYNDKIANAHTAPGNRAYIPVAKRIKSRMSGILETDVDLNLNPVSFLEFVRYISLQSPYEMDRHWYPVTRTIWHDTLSYDRIVKLEDFESGMRAVLEEAGIDPDLVDLRERANAYTPKVHRHYCAETVQLVRELYADDFTAFGYDAHRFDHLLEGASVRRFTKADLPSARRSAALSSQKAEPAPLTFIATGVADHSPLLDLIPSVFASYPNARLLIAWQGSAADELRAAAEAAPACTLFEIEEDAGLSAARNFLVEKVETEFFCLCDDDFVFTERDGLDHAVALLRAEPRIGVVGGSLTNFQYDLDGQLLRKEYLSYAGHLARMSQSGVLLQVPLQEGRRERNVMAGRWFEYCDIVLNFALMRRAVFDDGFGWDDRMKITGEHVDFFLSLKERGAWRVAYLPRLHCQHHRRRSAAYLEKRNRRQGMEILFSKWSLERLIKYPDKVEMREEGKLVTRRLRVGSGQNANAPKARRDNGDDFARRALADKLQRLVRRRAQEGGLRSLLRERGAARVTEELQRAWRRFGQDAQDQVIALWTADPEAGALMADSLPDHCRGVVQAGALQVFHAVARREEVPDVLQDPSATSGKVLLCELHPGGKELSPGKRTSATAAE